MTVHHFHSTGGAFRDTFTLSRPRSYDEPSRANPGEHRPACSTAPQSLNTAPGFGNERTQNKVSPGGEGRGAQATPTSTLRGGAVAPRPLHMSHVNTLLHAGLCHNEPLLFRWLLSTRDPHGAGHAGHAGHAPPGASGPTALSVSRLP